MDLFQGRMDLAVKYGADVAIFVHNVVYWVEKNAANRKNYYDGRYWTYNSTSALSEMYPLWSRDQIKRLVKKCSDLGVIILGNYNEDKRDRTNWYTPSDEILELYGLGKYALCNGRNRPMEETEPPDSLGETAPPLPSISSGTQDSPPTPPQGEKRTRRKRAQKAVPEWQAERFEKFWAAYPRDEDRAKAVEQWDALPKDKELMEQHGGDPDKLLDEIARGLYRHLVCDEWRNPKYVPYAFRWLRDRKWKEKAKGGAPPVPAFVPKPRSSRTVVVDGEEMVVFGP